MNKVDSRQAIRLVACGVVRDQGIGVLPCVAHGQTKGGAGCAATAAAGVLPRCSARGIKGGWAVQIREGLLWPSWLGLGQEMDGLHTGEELQGA